MEDDECDFDELLNSLKEAKAEREIFYQEADELVKEFKAFTDTKIIKSIVEKYSWEPTVIDVIKIIGTVEHYGIRTGKDTVIHYPGKSKNYHSSAIEEISINDFLLGQKYDYLRLKNSEEIPFTPSEVIERAKDRVGEDEYSVFFNNCEHFVTWCIFNEEESSQVATLRNIFIAGIFTRLTI